MLTVISMMITSELPVAYIPVIIEKTAMYINQHERFFYHYFPYYILWGSYIAAADYVVMVLHLVQVRKTVIVKAIAAETSACKVFTFVI